MPASGARSQLCSRPPLAAFPALPQHTDEAGSATVAQAADPDGIQSASAVHVHPCRALHSVRVEVKLHVSIPPGVPSAGVPHLPGVVGLGPKAAAEPSQPIGGLCIHSATTAPACPIETLCRPLFPIRLLPSLVLPAIASHADEADAKQQQSAGFGLAGDLLARVERGIH